MQLIAKISKKDYEDVKELQKNLDIYRVRLEKCDYINEIENFFLIMQDFWKFISLFDNERVYNLFEHSEYYAKYGSFFSAQENYYVRILEAMEAISIMTKQKERDQSFFDLFDRKLAKETYLQTNNEMNMIDFSDAKRLVMIGCGPLPETILYIYENTDINEIIGLDSNQEAIYMAGKMLNAQGVSRIKLMHINGLNYDYSDADIVYVANFITPKKKVLKRIAQTAKPNTQILTRLPVLLGRMLYETVTDDINPRLTLIKRGEVNPYFLWEPLVFKKLDI